MQRWTTLSRIFVFDDTNEGEDMDHFISDSSSQRVSNTNTITLPILPLAGLSPPIAGSHQIRVGTGRVIPKKFILPKASDTPQLLFLAGIGMKASPRVRRFIRRTDPTEFLIYTDGACLNNGREGSRGGCAFVFKPSETGEAGYMAFRLENVGPTEEQHQHTSNRAELRAVIAALRFRYWPGEGFKTLVIATDSEYVVEGATNWVVGWLRRGWRTSTGAPVKNQDLWQALLGEFERWSESSLEIKFWRIPRELNQEADRSAKDAATQDDCDEFCDVLGLLV